MVFKIRKKSRARCEHTDSNSIKIRIFSDSWAAATLSTARCELSGLVLNLSTLQQRAVRTGLLGAKSKYGVFGARWLIFTGILVVFRAATLCFGNLAPVHGPLHAAAPALAVRPGLLLGAPVLSVRGRAAALLLVAQIAIDFA